MVDASVPILIRLLAKSKVSKDPFAPADSCKYALLPSTLIVKSFALAVVSVRVIVGAVLLISNVPVKARLVCVSVVPCGSELSAI